MVFSFGNPARTYSSVRSENRTDFLSTMSSEVQFRIPTNVETDATSASSATAKLTVQVNKSEQFPKLEYVPPSTSSLTGIDHTLDVLKNGVIIENVQLSSKAYYVFGRLPQPACDIPLEHPSISRYHAILQCIRNGNDEIATKQTEGDVQLATGWYIYDLNSTHGTYVNKQRVTPRNYHAVKAGDFMRFGASTRQFILQTVSNEMDEPEQDSEVDKQEKKKEIDSSASASAALNCDAEVDTEAASEPRSAKKKSREKGRSEQEAEKAYCDWGFSDDPVKGKLDSRNPDRIDGADSTLIRELKYVSHYSNDPKRFLKRYFEHELGDEPNYEIVSPDGDRDEPEDRVISNQQHVRLQLPVLDELGRPVTIEVVRSGKRRDAIVECAREACEFLDRAGELESLMSGAARSSHRRKRAAEWAADDYYDSDEDLYTDRTGELEKKRSERMKRLGAMEEKVETYETLTAKLSDIDKQITVLRNELAASAAQSEQVKLGSSDDLLRHVEAGNFSAIADKVKRSQKKARLLTLEQDRQRVAKLVKIAQPSSFSILAASASNSTRKDSIKRSEAVEVPANSDKVIVLDDSPTDQINSEPQKQVAQQKIEDTEVEKKVTSTPASPRVDPALPVSESVDKKPEEAVQVTHKDSQPQKASEVVNASGAHAATRLKVPVDRTGMLKATPTATVLRMASRDVEEEFESDPEDVTDLPVSRRAASVSHKDDKAVPFVTEKHSYWVPPSNQSGDGRTSMNEKLGY